MAWADLDSNPMCCGWILRHPFLADDRTEISFLHERPMPLWWTATLRLTHRTLREWRIVFSLHCTDEDEDEDFTVVAKNVKLELRLNGEELLTRNLGNDLVFYEDNDHTISSPEIRIPARPSLVSLNAFVVFLEREGVKRNLEQLSTDFKKLYFGGRFNDFGILTEDSEGEHVDPVHLCMLRARLACLIRMGRIIPEQVTEQKTVYCKYPTDVVRYLLHYAYTGREEPRKWFRHILGFKKKLLTVINECALRRIFRTFSVSHSAPTFQNYETRYRILKEELNFRLDYSVDGTTEIELQGVTTLEMHGCITFSLRQQENPSFAYEMTFDIEVPIVIQVLGSYLENDVTKALLFEHIYHTNSIAGEYVFQDLTPEMGVFLGRCRMGEGLQDIGRLLNVKICLSDGSKTKRLQNLIIPKKREFNYDLNLLSNDMLAFLNSRAPADMNVYCGDYEFRVDRAIVDARVPNWRALLEPIEGDRVPEGDLLPGKYRSHLSFDAMNHIINFIYSGKVFPCSQYYFDEVYNAAYASGLYYLAAIWLIWDRDNDGSSQAVVE